MSVFTFYTEVNIGCICVLMLLLYSIKRLPTPQQKFKLFYKLVLWHILYFASDSLWALVNDGTILKNTFTVLAVNYSNAIVAAFLFYSCFMYAEISTRPEMTRVQIQRLQAKLSKLDPDNAVREHEKKATAKKAAPKKATDSKASAKAAPKAEEAKAAKPATKKATKKSATPKAE